MAARALTPCPQPDPEEHQQGPPLPAALRVWMNNFSEGDPDDPKIGVRFHCVCASSVVAENEHRLTTVRTIAVFVAEISIPPRRRSVTMPTSRSFSRWDRAELGSPPIWQAATIDLQKHDGSGEGRS
jgi:hypothetical protein